MVPEYTLNSFVWQTRLYRWPGISVGRGTQIRVPVWLLHFIPLNNLTTICAIPFLLYLFLFYFTLCKWMIFKEQYNAFLSFFSNCTEDFNYQQHVSESWHPMKDPTDLEYMAKGSKKASCIMQICHKTIFQVSRILILYTSTQMKL